MAVTNFIPTIWSARTAMHLDKSLVYGNPNVVNRNYQGEITQAGDRVRINQIGPVTVSSYTTNSDISTPETLGAGQAYLEIDQQEYFNFQVDDVDMAQANINLVDEASRRAGYAMADAVDQSIAGEMAGAVASGNTIGSNTTPKSDLGTVGNPYKYLVDLSVALDDANAPSQGRFAIVPPWFHGELLKDKDHVIATGSTFGDDVVIRGMVGQLAGLTIIKSNNVPNVSSAKYKIIAGVAEATTFASQIVSVEAYRMEKRFADAVKGLQVYGHKVVHPSALAMLIANAPS